MKAIVIRRAREVREVEDLTGGELELCVRGVSEPRLGEHVEDEPSEAAPDSLKIRLLLPEEDALKRRTESDSGLLEEADQERVGLAATPATMEEELMRRLVAEEGLLASRLRRPEDRVGEIAHGSRARGGGDEQPFTELPIRGAGEQRVLRQLV